MRLQYPIASSQAGTLYRTAGSGEYYHFMFKPRNAPVSRIILHVVPTDTGHYAVQNFVFQTTTEPFPPEWMVWICDELDLVGAGSRHRELRAFPRTLQISSWADTRFDDPRLSELTDALERRPDPQKIDHMREVIERILDRIGLPVRTHREPPEGFIGSWKVTYPEERDIRIEVYRQAPTFTKALSDYTGRPGKPGVEWPITYQVTVGSRVFDRYSLAEVLKATGQFIPSPSEDDWIEQNKAQAQLTFDPAVLEPYDLLGEPVPLAWPWERFQPWAEPIIPVDY
jgi:hypothetical protein